MSSDLFEQFMVTKELSNKKHPCSYFSIGNLETMKLIDPAVLKQWYKRYYSANTMALVIYSTQPIAELKQLAETYFAAIENRNLPNTAYPHGDIVPGQEAAVPKFAEKMYPADMLGKWIYVKPIRDTRSLTIVWELDRKFKEVTTKAADVASHVIGHEGEESLLAQLKRENLAEALSAHGQLEGDNVHFEIRVILTEEGLRQRVQVAQRVFEALQSFNSLPFPKHIYDELSYMSQVRYQWSTRRDASSTAQRFLDMLRLEPFESFPVRSLFYTQFDEALTKEVFQLLAKPANSFIRVVGKQEDQVGIKADRTEKWMQVQYGLRPFSKEELSAWAGAKPHPNVKYPVANKFVPTDVSLLNAPSPLPADFLPWTFKPQTLHKDTFGELHFLSDKQYFVPHACFSIDIRTPAVRPGQALAAVYADLYCRFVHEALLPLAYPAEEAGLHYDLSRTSTGMSLKVQGYSQKASTLLRELIGTMARSASSFTQDKFAIYLDYATRGYADHVVKPPLDQAMTRTYQVLHEAYVTPQEQLAIVRDGKINLNGLKTFAAGLFQKFYSRILVTGNLKEKDAWEVWDVVQHGLSSSVPDGKQNASSTAEAAAGQPRRPIRREACKQEEVARAAAVTMQNSTPVLYKEPVQVMGTGAVLVIDLLLGKTYDHFANAAMDVLSEAIADRFYDDLRTRQQCGYIVHARARELEVLGRAARIAHATAAGAMGREWRSLHTVVDLANHYLHLYEDHLAIDVRVSIARYTQLRVAHRRACSS